MDCEFYDGKKVPALASHARFVLSIVFHCSNQAKGGSAVICLPYVLQVKALAFITHPSSEICKVRHLRQLLDVLKICAPYDDCTITLGWSTPATDPMHRWPEGLS